MAETTPAPPRWLDEPLTYRHAIIGVLCWTVLDVIKATAGRGVALTIAAFSAAFLFFLLYLAGKKVQANAE